MVHPDTYEKKQLYWISLAKQVTRNCKKAVCSSCSQEWLRTSNSEALSRHV